MQAKQCSNKKKHPMHEWEEDNHYLCLGLEVEHLIGIPSPILIKYN